MAQLTRILAFAQSHAVLVAVAAVAALAVVVMVCRAVRGVARGHQAADVSTVVSAVVATVVALTGMWRFFGNVLHFSGPERVATFAFLELAMVTEAFRARRNVRESSSHTAGVDGVAVWVLSGLSALFSSLDAGSAAEAVFRLAPPLVAAWLWERGLSLYRREFTGNHRGIHWRITPERVLVRLGLAEPTGRATGEVAAQRRLAQLALAAKRARVLRAAGAAGWRQRWAARRLDGAMARAVEFAGLASDPGRQDDLLARMGALYGAAELATLCPPAPWHERLTPSPCPARPDAAGCGNGTGVRAATEGGAITAPGANDTAATMASAPLRGATAGTVTGAMMARPVAGGPATAPWRQVAGNGPATTATAGGGPGRGSRDWSAAASGPPGGSASGGQQASGNISDARGRRGETRQAMRAYWDQEIAESRIPTGADLNRAAGKDASYSLGKKYAAEWRQEIPGYVPVDRPARAFSGAFSGEGGR